MKRGAKVILKQVLLSGGIVTGIVFSYMHIWKNCKEAQSYIRNGTLANFSALKTDRGVRTDMLDFLAPYFVAGRRIYFWMPPGKPGEHIDRRRVSMECNITYMNYFFYPLTLRYGTEFPGGEYDIIMTKSAYSYPLSKFIREHNLSEKYNNIVRHKQTALFRHIEEKEVK